MELAQSWLSEVSPLTSCVAYFNHHCFVSPPSLPSPPALSDIRPDFIALYRLQPSLDIQHLPLPRALTVWCAVWCGVWCVVDHLIINH